MAYRHILSIGHFRIMQCADASTLDGDMAWHVVNVDAYIKKSLEGLYPY